jgi:hypothetical protein
MNRLAERVGDLFFAVTGTGYHVAGGVSIKPQGFREDVQTVLHNRTHSFQIFFFAEPVISLVPLQPRR